MKISMLAAMAFIAAISTHALAQNASAEDYSPESVWLGHWIFDKTATEATDKKSGKRTKGIWSAPGSAEQSFIDISQDKFHLMSAKEHLAIDCQWQDFKDQVSLLKCVDDTGAPRPMKHKQVERVEWQGDGTLHLRLRNGGTLVYRQP